MVPVPPMGVLVHFGRLYGHCCASASAAYMANVLLQSAACLVLSEINVILLHERQIQISNSRNLILLHLPLYFRRVVENN